ncbi:unnamed protein product [Bursaphelenchus xylophilus]|uniref:(pine wood nematode) hypothetical protein n=1 Tax=Bursaphelenchus xylophilus TaxID=6326 RepID=A0A7I8XLP9_BURXY|nr:unnamed protein product [Bursaphelenchus xylophilus]CAG9090027.1 unnamed protein product [Bursaphelenchus xylophilus]
MRLHGAKIKNGEKWEFALCKGNAIKSMRSSVGNSDKLKLNYLALLRSSLVLRQKPELRVKAIIEKLLYMSGRDQRRALFSLKQIFQDDKDLVHEFVQNEGLDCLIKLGRESDQTHQNHILRALGQLMLYVDGMNGIIAHNATICWLYELLESPYRLVVKTALKLLLVFVEYTESNALLLIAALSKVEKAKGRPEWSSLMKILCDKKASDVETLILGMTVVNKTLNGIPDQDTFFDVVDCLENLGLEEAMKQMYSLKDPQLTQQVQHYEHEVRKEDAAMQSDDSDPQLVRMRNGTTTNSQPSTAAAHAMQRATENNLQNGNDRRSMMRRRQMEAEELRQQQMEKKNSFERQPEEPYSNGIQNGVNHRFDLPKQPSWRSNQTNGIETNNNITYPPKDYEDEKLIPSSPRIPPPPPLPSTMISPVSSTGTNDEKENIDDERHQPKAPPPAIPAHIFSPTEHKTMEFPEPLKEPEPEPVKPVLTQKKDDSDDETVAQGGFAALLKKKAAKMESGSTFRKGILETKQSESEIRWKEAAEKVKNKPMVFNDIDFSALAEFEQDPLILVRQAQAQQERNSGTRSMYGAIPPPPPPGGGVPPPPPLWKQNGNMSMSMTEGANKGGTVRLHWKAAQYDAFASVPQLQNKGNFWEKVEKPQIDVTNLTKLFEQKQKELPTKKVGEVNKPQVLQVLSVKRSQAINIGLTKLPPISTIPPAIRKFDSAVLNKDAIEKILQTMMPTVEEVERIHEKQAEHPDMPLGQAEQFMLSLSEIDCLLERLRLWMFMLDYPTMEADVSESLNELKNAMLEVEESQTFRQVMGLLLTIGNALNGTEIQAFQLDFLSRASEVKDAVHKYPLTYHAAELMLNRVPESSDLHSEFGAVSRCSRLDFDAVHDNLKKMEQDCKACFDYVAKIANKDNSSSMKTKVTDYLNEVAQRIHNLKRAHRYAFFKWNSFLLYLGYGPQEIKDLKPMNVFKVIAEFALEYRTNRDKIVQMRKRMQEKRERNKTRGMMINAAQKQQQQSGFGIESKRTQPVEVSDKDRHQQMQRFLANSTNADENTLQRRRIGQPTPERQIIANEALRKSPGEDNEDELLDGVVRTVTAQAESRDHSRRRARQFNRKSLRRTRTIRADNLIGAGSDNGY